MDELNMITSTMEILFHQLNNHFSTNDLSLDQLQNSNHIQHPTVGLFWNFFPLNIWFSGPIKILLNIPLFPLYLVSLPFETIWNFIPNNFIFVGGLAILFGGFIFTAILIMLSQVFNGIGGIFVSAVLISFMAVIFLFAAFVFFQLVFILPGILGLLSFGGLGYSSALIGLILLMSGVAFIIVLLWLINTVGLVFQVFHIFATIIGVVLAAPGIFSFAFLLFLVVSEIIKAASGNTGTTATSA